MPMNSQTGLEVLKIKRSRNSVWNKRRGTPLDGRRIIAGWGEDNRRKLADYIDSKYAALPLGGGYRGEQHLSWYAWRGTCLSEMSDTVAYEEVQKLRTHGMMSAIIGGGL